MASSSSPESASTYIAVLTEFAIFGFRKTSMTVLAEAAGIARQTLYNRFKNKEAVLAWAVNGLTTDLRQQALAALANRTAPVPDVVIECLCHWLLPTVRLLRAGRHASEIFSLGASLRKGADVDPLTGIFKPIEQYLLDKKVFSNQQQASDSAFLLVMAAKGLLLYSSSEDNFKTDITRIVRGAGLNH